MTITGKKKIKNHFLRVSRVCKDLDHLLLKGNHWLQGLSFLKMKIEVLRNEIKKKKIFCLKRMIFLTLSCLWWDAKNVRRSHG